MNHAKFTLIALLLGGASLYAGGELNVNIDKSNEPAKDGMGITFRKEQTSRDYLKLGNNRYSGSGSGKEWGESEVTGSGFYLDLGMFFPPDNYLNPYFEGGDPSYKVGINFDLGSYFRFAKFDGGNFGIGMRFTWLSFSYAKMTDDKDIYRSLQICPVWLGPQFGMAFSEEFGADVYYQFGYNFTDQFGAIDDPSLDEDIGYNSVYTGFGQEIGAQVHYRVFTLGLGYRIGKVTNVAATYDGEAIDSDFLDDKKNSINSLRVYLGFKF